jgi:hypothetical protein
MSPDQEMDHSTAATQAINKWYTRAVTACAPFLFPESRFRMPWTGEDVPAAVEAARQWHRENPCPDGSLDQHLESILDAYGEMANATVARVMEIREIIEVHTTALDRRRKPRTRRSDAP